MQEGYIVWNESTAESEFFGVYRTYQQAEKAMRRVARNRLDYCPRDIDKAIEELDEMDCGFSSYKITHFEKNNGEELCRL